MKKYFLTGLATLLPLAVTVWFIRFLVNFLTHPFMGIATKLLTPLHIPENLIRSVSQLLTLIVLFIFVVLLGIFARWFAINLLLKIGDKILHKIPFVNKVYKTTKDMIQGLFSGDKKTFQSVVMLRFPYDECFVLGLVARDSPATCCTATKQEMITVYIPTTPNPTTGFLVMRPKDDLIYLKMHPEEAIKYIVSCGVVQPQYIDEEQLL
jgi:uncharacterized membrane protein